MARCEDMTGVPASMADSTEPKLDGSALRNIGAAYRISLVDLAELACRWLPDTTLTYVNDAYCRYFGKSAEELIGQSFLALIPEADRAALKAHTRGLARSLTPTQPAVSYEHRVDTPAGAVRWQEWTDRAIFDDAGRLVEFQSVGRDVTERKRTEQALAESRRTLQTLMDNLPGMVYRCRHDEHWTMEFASDGCLALTGYRPEEFVGEAKLSFADIIHPDDLQQVSERMEDAIGKGAPFQLLYRIIAADGTQKWVWEQGRAIYSGTNEFLALEGFITDITERKQAEQALQAEKERATVTLSSIADAVITTDRSGRVEYMNAPAEALTGWSLEQAVAKPFDEVCNLLSERTRTPAVNFLSGGTDRDTPAGGAVLVDRRGREFLVEDTVAPICVPQGEALGYVVVFRDVTEARQLQHHIMHQATHDPLTGLVNRYEFERRLDQLLQETREFDSQHALCYLDLDQFKLVNDTCGHAAGDQLLRQLSVALRARIRAGDTLARLGGDEFGVLLTDCPAVHAQRLSNGILESLEDFRFTWEGKTFSIAASIGVVPITASSEDRSALLSAADAACYAAKDRGRNRVHVYQVGDSELVRRQGEMQWVSRIREAIEANRLELHRQRIVPVGQDAASLGEFYEILLRLRSEDGKLVPPGAFLPAAERYGLAPALDRWVIEHVLGWLSQQPEHLEKLRHCAINVSGQSISDDRFLEFLATRLSDSPVPAHKLCFEITETAAVANLVHATSFISALADLGCTFALDDFGTGMSSFVYLKNLPVQYLKIDGAFVRDIADDAIDLAMVKCINQVAHVMGKQTIAEVVETTAILQRLKSMGVDFAQGYAVAKPTPLGE